jgi:hypothetical protein
MDDDALQALAYQCELEQQEQEELKNLEDFYRPFMNGDIGNVESISFNNF